MSANLDIGMMPAATVAEYGLKSRAFLFTTLAFFADNTRLLDIYGLGSNDPIRFRRQPGGYGPDSLRGWAKDTGAHMAVLQICWSALDEYLPPEWPLVALWVIPRNVAFRDRLVAFVAIDPSETQRLRSELQEYPHPQDVTIRYPPDGTTVGSSLAQLRASPECVGTTTREMLMMLIRQATASSGHSG